MDSATYIAKHNMALTKLVEAGKEHMIGPLGVWLNKLNHQFSDVQDSESETSVEFTMIGQRYCARLKILPSEIISIPKGQLVVQITPDPNRPDEVEEILTCWFDPHGNIFFEPNGVGVDFAGFLEMFIRKLLDWTYERDLPVYP